MVASTAQLQAFAAEAFTLLSVGILIIFVRTYARWRQVGIRNFEADDYLMLFVIVPYTIETSLAYTVGAKYHGYTNSAMTTDERASLSPDSDEYHWRSVRETVIDSLGLRVGLEVGTET